MYISLRYEDRKGGVFVLKRKVCTVNRKTPVG